MSGPRNESLLDNLFGYCIAIGFTVLFFVYLWEAVAMFMDYTKS
jgi:hypothetical protein